MATSMLTQLITLADNHTPSQRKIWALAAGVIVLAMGVTFIGLSIWSVMVLGHNFDQLAFGTGGGLLATPLLGVPLALAKAMQLVPDTTTAPDENA